MTISDKKVVSLSYQLREKDAKGSIIETVSADKPLVFIYGAGNLLPKFESNITGLKVGDEFSFKLGADDAYGQIQEEAVVSVPKTAFMSPEGEVEEGLLEIDNVVPMMDHLGNRLQGVIVEINEDAVKMDFNHPLAGEDLFFSGTVVDLRDATKEELEHGHVHGSGDCGGGSCNSGSCDSCSCGC